MTEEAILLLSAKPQKGTEVKTVGTKWLHQITPQKVEEELHMFQLETNSSNPIKLNVSVNGSLLPMELDTGAAVFVISLRTKNKYFPTVPLKESIVYAHMCMYIQRVSYRLGERRIPLLSKITRMFIAYSGLLPIMVQLLATS